MQSYVWKILSIVATATFVIMFFMSRINFGILLLGLLSGPQNIFKKDTSK